jgi:hypothetical protein
MIPFSISMLWRLTERLHDVRSAPQGARSMCPSATVFCSSELRTSREWPSREAATREADVIRSAARPSLADTFGFKATCCLVSASNSRDVDVDALPPKLE